ncbi:MAG: hypothetical protein WD468_02125 [Pirellulales bacterium]
MDPLQQELDRLLGTLSDAGQIHSRLESLVSVYPFNEYEFIISHLLARDVLSLDQYLELRVNYIARNRYRSLFELGPTALGTTWAEEHLLKLVFGLKKAKTGKHDLLLDDVRVEVKTSRAVDKKSKKPLVQKALLSDSSRPFLMNFQQTKAEHFDVIVWIGIWLDSIRYWVLAATEVETHRRFSGKQHRGNIGEGQLHVTNKNINDFDGFDAQPNKLAEAIREAYKRQRAAINSG